MAFLPLVLTLLSLRATGNGYSMEIGGSLGAELAVRCGADFDRVPGRVFEVDLMSAVGPRLALKNDGAAPFEGALGLVDVIDEEGEVIRTAPYLSFFGGADDEVQLLVGAETKPGTGEVERGALDLGETEDITVVGDADVEILDEQCNVVESSVVHGALAPASTPRSLARVLSRAPRV